jgi:trigger factor
MKITLNKIDSVNATLTIEVVKEDYAEKVKHGLKEISKATVIPGFRKGMAPLSILQKMYGKSVLADELNKLVSDQLNDYIKENDLNILGEPLPHEGEKKSLSFDNQEDFEFTFDLGLTPEINIKLTKDDKIPYYTITVTDEMIDEQITGFKANYGSTEEVDDIQEKDVVKGLLTELNEDGSPKEDGVSVEEAVLMPSYMKNEEEKNKFIGTKLGELITFNPHTAYEGNETELNSFLKIKKEEVKNHTGNFTFKVEKVTRYKEAEVNRELFDKIYEPGTVTSEEEFRGHIKEAIAYQLIPESDYRLIVDARKLLEDKAIGIQLPDASLKRWLAVTNPDWTAEVLEDNYPKIVSNLKLQLVKENILKENNIKIEEEEIRQYAIEIARKELARYGMKGMPLDVLEEYAQKLLKDKKAQEGIVEKVAENRLVPVLKKSVTLENKEITIEEFTKLFEQENNSQINDKNE